MPNAYPTGHMILLVGHTSATGYYQWCIGHKILLLRHRKEDTISDRQATWYYEWWTTGRKIIFVACGARDFITGVKATGNRIL